MNDSSKKQVRQMKVMKRILMGVAATAALSTAVPAFADYLPGDEPKVERTDDLQMMVAFMSGDQFTPSRLEFRQLSADPVRDLVKIAETAKYGAVLRARAIQSLPLYLDDERAKATVDGLMTSTKPGSALFGATLIAYAAMHGEAVTDAVAPYAEHPSADVRLAAVVALGQFCGQAGFDTLRNLVAGEEDADVKARMNQLVN